MSAHDEGGPDSNRPCRRVAPRRLRVPPLLDAHRLVTPESSLFASQPLLPVTLSLAHYRALFDQRDFWIPIRNSLVVATATAVVALPIATACAYALARLPMRGRGFLLALILAISMFPQISVVTPLYLILRELHLLNTYPGLVLPTSPFPRHWPCGCSRPSSGSYPRTSRTQR